MRFVTKAYSKLLDLSPAGQTVNICTGRTHSLREVINLCEEITDHSIEIQVNHKFVRENEVHVLQGDNSYLKSLIGDLPMPSLKETLQWMLSENKVVIN